MIDFFNTGYIRTATQCMSSFRYKVRRVSLQTFGVFVTSLIWNLTSAQDIRLAIPNGHRTPIINKIGWSSSEATLASLDANNNLVIWDARSGAIFKNISNISDFEWSNKLPFILGASGQYLVRYQPGINRLDTIATFKNPIRHIHVGRLSKSWVVLDQNGAFYEKKDETSEWISLKIPKLNSSAVYDIHVDKKIIAVQGNPNTSIFNWGKMSETKIFGLCQNLKFSSTGERIAITSTEPPNQYQLHVVDLLSLESQQLYTANQSFTSLSFSSNGRYIVSGNNDAKYRVYDLLERTSIYEHAFEPEELIRSTDFIPNTDRIFSGTIFGAYCGSTDTSQNPKLLFDYPTFQINYVVEPSRSGKYVAASYKTDIYIYDGSTNEQLLILKNHAEAPINSHITSNGKHLITDVILGQFRSHTYQKNVIIQELETGITKAVIEDHNLLEISQDGELAILGTIEQDQVIGFDAFDMSSLKLKNQISIASNINCHSLHKDNNLFVFGLRDNTVQLLDVSSGSLDTLFFCSNDMPINCFFAPDSDDILVLNGDNTLYKYNRGIKRVYSEKQIDFDLLSDSWDGMALHPTESLLLTYDYLTGAIMLYDYYSDEFILAWSVDDLTCPVRFSKDGQFVLTGRQQYRIDINNLYEQINANKWPIELLDTNKSPVGIWTCSPQRISNSKTYIFWSSYNSGELKDAKNNVLAQISHYGQITNASFDAEERVLITSGSNGETKFWDIKSGRLLFTQYFFDGKSDQWLIYDNQGYFDASPAAMKLLHWIVDGETVDFDQLKRRFWVPNLWQYAIGGDNKYQERSIKTIKLYPEVTKIQTSSDSLHIGLKRRDGGYGPIQLYVDGKERIIDLRGPSFDSTALNVEFTLSLDSLNLASGQNTIELFTENEDRTVRSKGAQIRVYNPVADSIQPPSFYGLIIGVNTYKDSTLNLSFPVQDAKSIAKAMKIGAENLFGKRNTHISVLKTDSDRLPNKEAVMSLMDSIALKSRPQDVIFIYMSGHGIAEKTVDGEFYFLTPEATSNEIGAISSGVSNPELYISTDEWAKHIAKIAARKQVMVIDACGAGKAVEKLSTYKSVDANQLKAIDRMRDRTGMFVLSGCAATAVSYESNLYGQGVLTYAVLEAMRGAAINSNGEVDIQKLMIYVRDRVPMLAKDLGAIQEPQCLFASKNSFPIAIINDVDRALIPLAESKSVVINSLFLNASSFQDDLKISEACNTLLAQNSGSTFVYFNIDNYPNAIRLSGGYKIKKRSIELKLIKSSGSDKQEVLLKARSKELLLQDLETLIQNQLFN